MGKMVKCHLKGKTCSKLANGLNFYDLKKKLTPGFALLSGYIHVYYRSSQTRLFVYISGLRLAFTGPLVLRFILILIDMQMKLFSNRPNTSVKLSNGIITDVKTMCNEALVYYKLTL